MVGLNIRNQQLVRVTSPSHLRRGPVLLLPMDIAVDSVQTWGRSTLTSLSGLDGMKVTPSGLDLSSGLCQSADLDGLARASNSVRSNHSNLESSLLKT